MKVCANKFVIIDQPLSNDDLTINVFNGLSLDFHDIASLIRVHEILLTFEELYDLLVSHESYLKCHNFATTTTIIYQQYLSIVLR